jgi:hypothetical protein
LYFKAEHIHDLRISGEYLPANYAQFIFWLIYFVSVTCAGA